MVLPGRPAGRRGAWRAIAAGLVLALVGTGRLHAQPDGSAGPLSILGGADDVPMTVVGTRYVLTGCGPTFEALMHSTFDQADEVPGHPSADFLRPADLATEPYTLILHFDRTGDYRQWLASPARTDWLERSAELTDGSVQYQYRSGLEVWATLPDQPGYNPPDALKTMTVNWLAIYPVTMALAAALTPVTAGWPAAASTALRTGLMVSVVHYGVMPFLGRIFRDWLYPPPEICRE